VSADAACARPPICRHREDPEGSHLDAAPQQDEHRDEVPYGKAYRAQAYDHVLRLPTPTTLVHELLGAPTERPHRVGTSIAIGVRTPVARAVES
jgi:hypothetical protein